MYDVVVIGGGVIGLSIAREMSPGRRVLVLDRGVAGAGTSWAAAGMLAPQSEADDDGPLFQLSMASLRIYSRFIDDLKSESGVDPEYQDDGLLLLAFSSGELVRLETRAAWQHAAGMPVEMLKAPEVLKLEPLITADVQGALFLPGDHQVAPRKLVKALVESCIHRGVDIRNGVAVNAVVSDRGRLVGVHTDGEMVHSQYVVVASGAWSGGIEGLDPSIPVYPRKGQILSLTMPDRAIRRTIRWKNVYFVPRRDGELVVGATDEDAGFDRALTPSGLGSLLLNSQQISSHIGDFPIRETWTGLRPATPDGLPVLGPSAIEGLLYATGHYRNGILLAPVTAKVIAAVINDQPAMVPMGAFASGRFNV